MKIIVAGNGKVGAALVRALSAEGYDLTLIDTNASVLQPSVETYDIMAVHGNCASMSVLREADVASADLLIATTPQDEVNLLCCLTARELNPKLHTIARIRTPEYMEQVFEMRDVFALSMIVNPERQTAREVDRLMKYPGFLHRDTFAKSRAELVELKVETGSKLSNVRLIDLNAVIGCKVLVCAVLRNGEAIMPGGHFVLQEGDRIFVTSTTDNLSILLKNLGIYTKKVRQVVICGGGKLGYYAAQKLMQSHIHVKIIERDHARCLELAELLPDADIIEGDATNQELLDSEGIAQNDALISMTGMDELNTMISLYAQKMGVSQIVTKVAHMGSSRILDSLSIGSIVCPKDLCCTTIVRYVRAIRNQAGAAISIHSIADGMVEALEFRVTKDTRYCGVPLKNLRLKNDVLIASITKGVDAEIPDGESTFDVGDTIVVTKGGNEVIYSLNDIFA